MDPEEDVLDPPEPYAHEVAPRVAAFDAAAQSCSARLAEGDVRAAALAYRDQVDPALDRLLELSDRALDAGAEDEALQAASDDAELRAESLVEQLEANGIAFDDVELPILDP